MSQPPLDVVLSELGPPDCQYRLSAGRLRTRLVVGTILIIYGIIANYLWWVPGPQRVDHTAFLILIAPTLSGISILRQLYRSLGLHLLIYPTGILRLQGEQVESYPWSDLEEIRIKTGKGMVQRIGTSTDPKSVWIAVDAPWLVVGNAVLTLTRADGASLKITPAVSDYIDLVERVQRVSFVERWPIVRDRLLAGEIVTFGPFQVHLDGLFLNKQVIPWSEITEVELSDKNLVVKRQRKWLPAASQDLDTIPNPHLCLALIDLARSLGERPA